MRFMIPIRLGLDTHKIDRAFVHNEGISGGIMRTYQVISYAGHMQVIHNT